LSFEASGLAPALHPPSV